MMKKKVSRRVSEGSLSPLERRSAGILMHITSLPGNYGIGDMGGEAKKFADYLVEAKQHYWQLLPLNPTEAGKGHSPYSSMSSIAGNPLLISPEWLVEKGWLRKQEPEQLPNKDKVDFDAAEESKDQMLKHAFEQFSKSRSLRWRKQFDNFCAAEENWLNDFALYAVLKNNFGKSPWHLWPEEFKRREPKALRRFQEQQKKEIERTKWIQFVFYSQWRELKAYCNSKGIELFGDMPFYVDYDSVDVWAYPEIFNLDKQGRVAFAAGVPPDYFNADGQLWGMPVFRWDVLKKQRYGWWINRLKKNMELFDLVRLDHFRAFADYWAVPAAEKTARNGKWLPGPGADLFVAAQKKLGRLTFVAEDLGDINDDVYALRDEFLMPGMKVLQFAFGDNMPQSDYIPHNYRENFLVYTGTHDNNTTRGWFNADAGEVEKKNLKRFFGEAPTTRNIHTLLIRLAYQSIARTVIVPMQDVLGLDEKARMNSPASAKNNWLWRLKPGLLTRESAQWLGDLTEAFNRN
jgi:4-alpha-glucanotransferase